MNGLPCTHLSIDIDERGACLLGRHVPTDCADCRAYAPVIADAERQVCEVWNRVMGYHRPISAWNAGKQQEHRDRVPFREPS